MNSPPNPSATAAATTQRRSRPQAAFTLLEIVITLAILSLLAALAAPAMSSWTDNSRAKAARQQLQALVGEARQLALQNAQRAVICRLESNSCATPFAPPLSLFIDTNANDQLDNDEKLTRVIHLNLPDRISLTWNSGDLISFTPTGTARSGSLRYCDSTNPRHDFRLVIASTARTRIDPDIGCPTP
ncbi:MAG: GspH/FimT family protein [Cellvibrionales bacterium]|nr:GspH/FimT family protein [Cellvibrionales bacterium]